MAIARVGTTFASGVQDASTTKTFAVTANRDSAAGRVLVAGVVTLQTGGSWAMTDTRGNTWTKIAEQDQDGSTQTVVLFYTTQDSASLVTGDSITLSTNVAINRHVVVVEEFSGLSPLSPSVLHDTNFVTTATADITAGSVDLTSREWLTVTCYGLVGSTAAVAPEDGSTQTQQLITAGGSNERSLAYQFKITTGPTTFVTDTLRGGTGNYVGVVGALTGRTEGSLPTKLTLRTGGTATVLADWA